MKQKVNIDSMRKCPISSLIRYGFVCYFIPCIGKTKHSPWVSLVWQLDWNEALSVSWSTQGKFRYFVQWFYCCRWLSGLLPLSSKNCVVLIVYVSDWSCLLFPYSEDISENYINFYRYRFYGKTNGQIIMHYVASIDIRVYSILVLWNKITFPVLVVLGKYTCAF